MGDRGAAMGLGRRHTPFWLASGLAMCEAAQSPSPYHAVPPIYLYLLRASPNPTLRPVSDRPSSLMECPSWSSCCATM